MRHAIIISFILALFIIPAMAKADTCDKFIIMNYDGVARTNATIWNFNPSDLGLVYTNATTEFRIYDDNACTGNDIPFNTLNSREMIFEVNATITDNSTYWSIKQLSSPSDPNYPIKYARGNLSIENWAGRRGGSGLVFQGDNGYNAMAYNPDASVGASVKILLNASTNFLPGVSNYFDRVWTYGYANMTAATGTYLWICTDDVCTGKTEYIVPWYSYPTTPGWNENNRDGAGSSSAATHVEYAMGSGTGAEWWFLNETIFCNNCYIYENIRASKTIGIYIISPENSTYYNSSVPLSVGNYTTIVSWMYSLNGESNITFTPNTTIAANEGLNSITVWANDSDGKWYYDTEYFTVNYWNISSQIYDSVLYSPMTTVYSISLTITNETAISSLNASLVINGTDYSYDYYSVSGTSFSFYKEIDINESATQFQYLSHWNVTVISGTGTTYDSTDSITQPGYLIQITNCTYSGISSEKFDLKSELTSAAVTGDLHAYFTAWVTAGKTISYSFNVSGASSYTFCIAPNISVYNANIELVYNATGYSDRTMYFYNATMDNTTDTNVLYLLPNTVGSRIKIHVVDRDNSDIIGAVVKIQRYIFGVAPYGGWQTVQSFMTDNDGEGQANIILNTVTYRYIIEVNGEEIHSEEKSMLYDGTTLQTLTISLAEGNIEWMQLNEGFHPYCTYSNETHIERCYISDSSGLVTSTTMSVDKIEPLGKTNICSLTSSLSTITQQCSLGSSPSGIYRTTLKVTVSSGNIYTYTFDPITIGVATAYGDDGIFLQILLIMTFMLIGAWNGSFGLLLGVGSLFVGSIVGINALTLPSIVGILIGALIIIYKVK